MHSTGWSVGDSKGFESLVQRLKDLIDDLEAGTRLLGVEGHQHDFIRYKVESVPEISILETAEETRMGGIDTVSDATSLRLWQIRDGRAAIPIDNQSVAELCVGDETRCLFE